MQVLRKHSASSMIRIGYNLHVPSILKSIYLTGKDGLRLLEHFPFCGMRVASMLQGDDFENTIKNGLSVLPYRRRAFRPANPQQYESFEALNKPPLSPSGWLFRGVWTILFALMGTTSYLVVSEKPGRTTLNVYGAELLFNFVWSLLFSTWHNTCLPLTDS